MADLYSLLRFSLCHFGYIRIVCRHSYTIRTILSVERCQLSECFLLFFFYLFYYQVFFYPLAHNLFSEALLTL